MGKVRTCDARCHEARLPLCVCWCGGLFHGAEGRAARDAFVDAFRDPATDRQSFPETEDEFFQGDLFKPDEKRRWQAAVRAAVEARSARASTTESGPQEIGEERATS